MQQDGVVLSKPPLNKWAVVGLVVSTFVACAALFLLPALQDAGISFGIGFWSIAAVEFITAIAGAYFVVNLRQDGEVERY